MTFIMSYLNTMITTNCQICQSPFLTYPSKIKYGRAKFCTQICYAKWMSTNQRAERHPMFGKKHSPKSLELMRQQKQANRKTGSASTNWKGGKFLSRGYLNCMITEL